MSFSIQASVWVGSLIVRPHLYHSTAPLFRVCVFLFLGSLNVLAWHGTFLTKHRTLPWPPHRPRRECDQSIPHIGLDGLICLSFRPTTTIRSPPPTKRKPRTFPAGHRLGWARPPSLLPHAPPSFQGRCLRRLQPMQAIQGRHRLIFRPKTFVESIRPTGLPIIR